ncbi:MAG TPA: tetraacyldisaccharide 4'-kinase, partial [Pyrinomonadaceae bacterium]|nr:tetraacyldisaccharide 4'-kinase [Pyrinomonadaceae bacterium]
AAARSRLAFYRGGVLPVERVSVPVLSVGNITAGGTGKTPLVEWLARAAAGEGRRVCILTRGYGRADASRRVVVSDGERVLADAREGGDEPLLLAESLRGLAAVVSDADRVAAARWAIEKLRSEVFVLDDGFQHLRIARDLNILTLDATDPWGGAKLLPRGRLREPLGGMKRADLIVITRAELCGDIEALRARAETLSGGRPVLVARTVTLGVKPLASEATAKLLETNSLPQPLAAFCAVGNPQAFFAHARKEGLTLSYTRAFPDHHVYKQSDADDCVREAARHGARGFLTTPKDAVKLRALDFALPCYVLEIALRFDDEQRMRAVVRETISRGGL